MLPALTPAKTYFDSVVSVSFLVAVINCLFIQARILDVVHLPETGLVYIYSSHTILIERWRGDSPSTFFDHDTTHIYISGYDRERNDRVEISLFWMESLSVG